MLREENGAFGKVSGDIKPSRKEGSLKSCNLKWEMSFLTVQFMAASELPASVNYQLRLT